MEVSFKRNIGSAHRIVLLLLGISFFTLALFQVFPGGHYTAAVLYLLSGFMFFEVLTGY